MQFFQKLDLPELMEARAAIALECEQNDALWLRNQNRQKRIPVQRHTEAISLRRGIPDENGVQRIEDVHASEDAPLSKQFPEVMSFLSKASIALNGELSRAMLVRLVPRSQVYPHIDHGNYYKPRDRYHFVIVSRGGSPMTANSESVVMREGELWWFDNKVVHSSDNPSDYGRIHIIFDLLPFSQK